MTSSERIKRTITIELVDTGTPLATIIRVSEHIEGKQPYTAYRPMSEDQAIKLYNECARPVLLATCRLF